MVQEMRTMPVTVEQRDLPGAGTEAPENDYWKAFPEKCGK
jgi:hypothetical protein